jgi:hypothetical protein
VEPAAEAVDDRASSAHAPSPARPTALARTPARLAIYHHQSTGSKLLSSRVPSLLYSLGAVSHCSYSRTLVSLPRRAVPVQVQANRGESPEAPESSAAWGLWGGLTDTEWRAENDGRA